MKVLWTESAVAQLQGIHDFLAQTSPEYALRIVDRLTARSIQIATFPFSGRIVPEYELNEIREVIERSYRIIYLIESEQQKVEVLAVNSRCARTTSANRVSICLALAQHALGADSP